MATPATEYLDSLTRAATAFPCWISFTAAIRSGYTPTLNPTQRAARKLASQLKSVGLPCWNPSTGMNW